MYRIVIIDDEKWVVRSLRSAIREEYDFEVVGEAYNGLEGWELISREKPDIAFVDIRMPGISGLQLLQRANEEQCATLFAVVSGYAEFAYAQKAMFNGAIGYCLKPFSQSEINETLQKAKRMLDERTRGAQPQQPAQAPQEEEKLPPVPTVKNEMVQSILNYIGRHFCEDISIRQVADVCCVNPNYASQLFNREMGESFNNYLSVLRISLASRMLASTNKPIAQVAEESGFRDYFYFARVFKKFKGITPTEYREEASQKASSQQGEHKEEDKEQ